MDITNPAFNYDSLDDRYANIRQADHRISKYIYNAIGTAKIVLNVGAGTGLYKPTDVCCQHLKRYYA